MSIFMLRWVENWAEMWPRTKESKSEHNEVY